MTANQAIIDQFSGDLAQSALSDAQKTQKAILNVIFVSDNYEEAMVRLLEMYPDLSMGRFEEIMEKGLLNASLFGIWSQDQEAHDD